MTPADLPHRLAAELAERPPGALAVAFSGGLDSTVLLHALAGLPAARARGLRALHVDHGLQPASGAWATHCVASARALDLDCRVLDAHVARDGRGLEDAARQARYGALAQELGAGETLVLAQHRDDQAETILLKLLRGAGPEGLGGMRAARACGAGTLWRPLLDVPRAALSAYAAAHALTWIDDPSNADPALRRNFLRAEILPRLATQWPDAPAALAHSATWARAAADFIESEAAKALAALQGLDPATLHWRGWLALPAALRDPVLRAWLRALGRDEPAHFHVRELERQLAHAAADRNPCVAWAGTEVRRYRESIHALRARPAPDANWRAAWDSAPFALPGGGRLAFDQAAPTAPLHLTLAFRRGGERLKPAGAAHSRELRLLLQECGLPPWQRARLPLVYAGDELIAAADLVLSARAEELCAEVGARWTWHDD